MAEIDQQLTRLILEEYFGLNVSIVGQCLCTRGRLPLALIVKYTGLKSSIVKESLQILLQLNLIKYTDEYDQKLDRTTSYYSLNDADSVLKLIRIGLYLAFLKEHLQLTDIQVQIVKKLITYGASSQSSIKDIVQKSDQVVKVLSSLLDQNIIQKINPVDLQNIQDLIIQKQDEEKTSEDYMKMGSTRKRKAVDSSPNDLVGSRLRQSQSIAEQHSFKKFKLNGGQSQVQSDYFRLNLDRVHVLLRDYDIAQVAGNIHKFSQEIIQSVLQQSSINIQHPLVCDDIVKFNLMKIAAQLQQNPDSLLQQIPNNDRAKIIRNHMNILASNDSGHVQLLYQCDNNNYNVNYAAIITAMKEEMIEQYVMTKHGSLALRIFRAVKSQKIVDDKLLTRLCLIDMQEARRELFKLIKDQMLVWQMVPRSTDRAPNRALYTVRVNDQIENILIDRIKKSIFNALQKMKQIRKDSSIQELLKKCDREDVKNDDSLLSDMEKNLLDKYQSAVKRIYASIFQMDKSLRILTIY